MFEDDFIPPSGLLEALSDESLDVTKRNLSNTPLRLGVITKVHDVDSDSNVSKIFPEYDIVTSEQNKKMGQGFTEYTNCVSIDSFGGLGDFFEFKRRESESEEFRKTYDFSKQNGSMVVMLCLDGFSDKGIIIGGLSHQKRKTNLDKEAGLHLEGEYNGLNWKIDKDGALNIKFKSKTDNDGKPQDETAGGTYFEINKTGSIDLNTGLEEKEATSIKIDKTKKDIAVTAGNSVNVAAVADVSITADGKVSVSAKGGMDFATEGAAKVSAKSSLDLEGKSTVGVKSETVMISGTNMVQIEGGKTMINSPKVFVGQGGTPAVTVLTKFLGTGSHGNPVVSSAIGPYSAVVFIA